MVAENKRRGRRMGSRNALTSVALGVSVPGAASSAAKMNCRPGFAEWSSLWLYVPGEGFVRWAEIEAQFAEAYLQWRRKKAMQGVQIVDGWEWRQHQIEEALAQRGAPRGRVGFLREFRREQRRAEMQGGLIEMDEARALGVWVEREVAA